MGRHRAPDWLCALGWFCTKSSVQHKAGVNKYCLREREWKKEKKTIREERRKGGGRKIESRTTFRFQRQPSRWSNLHTSKCPEPLTRYRWTCLSNRMITHRFQQIPGFEQSLTADFLLSFAATPRPHAMQDVLNGEGSSAFG